MHLSALVWNWLESLLGFIGLEAQTLTTTTNCGQPPHPPQSSVKVAPNLFKLIVIICGYSVLIFDGQHVSNTATLYK